MYGRYQQSYAADEAAATGLLQHLNKDELQKILDDDQKLDDLVKDLQQVKNLSIEKETLLTSNKSVAEYNLSQEPRLAQSKNQLAATYEQAVEVQKSFEQNKQKLDYHAAQQSLDTTLALLQTEAAKSEEDTEELADKFLQDEVTVDNFLENYISQRRVAHQRRVKVEKMKEIMETQARAARSAAYNPPPAPMGNATPPVNNWNNPYPNYSAMPNVNNYMPQ